MLSNRFLNDEISSVMTDCGSGDVVQSLRSSDGITENEQVISECLHL